MNSQHQKITPFHEDSFVKVYLSFVIIAGLLSIIMGIAAGPSPESNSLVLTVLGGISGLIGLATFVMSIIAWVQWHKRKYPKAARMLAITHTILPLVFTTVGMILSALWFMKNAAQFEHLEPGQTPNMAALGDVPPFFTALNWVSMLISAVYIGWAIYLFNLKQNKAAAHSDTHTEQYD